MLCRRFSINAPAGLVWEVFSDVERWSEWTASIRSVELLDGPLRVGARARIRQPKLPVVIWTVTEFVPGERWTWIARAPGSRTTAHHVVRPAGEQADVELGITPAGWIGKLAFRLTRSLTHRYLDLEAAGLKRVCEARATSRQ